MFFTSISEIHTSLHLSYTFLSNVGCFSLVLPALGIICTDLAGFAGFFAYLTGITGALAASVVACVITFIILCLAAILLWLPYTSLSYIYIS